jgi:hypothetical protein
MYTNPRQPIRPPVSSRFDPATGRRVTVRWKPPARPTALRRALREQGWH